MATDIRDLRIRIRGDDARRELENVEQGVDRIGQAADRVSTAALGLGAALAGLATGALIGSFIEHGRELDDWRGRLETATDSVEEAAKLLREFQEISSRTPVLVEDMVTAFTRLANYGVTPTVRQLEGLSNFASATGGNLDDLTSKTEELTDAIRDASIGGFTMLEEFAILAEDMGDRVAFTFEGVTTVVRKSGQEILQYVTEIGNTRFADALTDRVQGLAGAMNALNAEFSRTATTANTIFSPALESVINQITSLIRVANNATDAVKEFFARDVREEIRETRGEIEKTENKIKEISQGFAARVGSGDIPISAIDNFNESIEKQRIKLEELNDTLNDLNLENIRNIPPIFEGVFGSQTQNNIDETNDALDETSDVITQVGQSAEKARVPLTDLIVSIKKTKEAFIQAEMASAGFTLESLEDNLRSYTSTDIDPIVSDFAFDFAGKFWGVFQNQGEFTLESLIGTFQSWGLELAQQIDFQPLFDQLSSGLGSAATQGLGAGLASFGVGATAGGLAGGGPLGIFAGAASGAATGYLVGGPPGAGIGAVAGGLGAFLSQSGASDNTFRFRLRGGVGGLRGDAGPDAGNFQPFIDFIQSLEDSIARTFNDQQLAAITESLEGFESATVRMIEGGFDAEKALALLKDRLTEFADTMGEGFAKLFRDIEHDTVESTEEAIQALLAVRATMDEFGVSIYAARALLEEAALTGESYAETLGRIASAQAILDQALFSAEERQERQLATAKDRIDEFNEALGLTGDAAIDTREELRAYHDELDVGTAAGREAFLALLAVGDAFQLVFDSATAAAPAVEETAEAVAELEQEAFDATSVMRDVVGILNDYVSWNYRLAGAINAVTQEMAGWELALQQANSTVQLFQVASAAGAPLDVRMQLFNQAFSQFQSAYQQAQQQISQDLQARIAAIREEYAELIELEREAGETRREALQSELDITRQWAGTLSSVEGIIGGLQSGGLTPFGASTQLALGAAGIAGLQSQFAGATGAARAQLGQELAAALSAQLGLTQGFFGVGPQSYLDEYNRTMEQLTAIQEEAAAEAARQSELEQALVDLQVEQAANIDRLTEQMDAEITAAQDHADRQVEAVNNFALGVYAEFDRVGQQLYRELLQQRIEQAQQEAQNRQIQVEQLQALLVIRDGFIAAGLVDPTATARANARTARYL